MLYLQANPAAGNRLPLLRSIPEELCSAGRAAQRVGLGVLISRVGRGPCWGCKSPCNRGPCAQGCLHLQVWPSLLWPNKYKCLIGEEGCKQDILELVIPWLAQP